MSVLTTSLPAQLDAAAEGKPKPTAPKNKSTHTKNETGKKPTKSKSSAISKTKPDLRNLKQKTYPSGGYGAPKRKFGKKKTLQETFVRSAQGPRTVRGEARNQIVNSAKTKDGYKCAYCDKVTSKKRIEVDHKVPYSKGGATAPTNMVPACKDCNRKKSDKSVDRFLKELKTENPGSTN